MIPAWMKEYRSMEPGEIVKTGDVMRIGDNTFIELHPCKYDKQGEICCIGQTVEEWGRFFTKLSS